MMTRVFALSLAVVLLAHPLRAEEAKPEPLPILESVEIYATRVQKRPVKYEYSLDFVACKETAESDWKLEIEIAEVTKERKYAIIAVRPQKPLNCETKFRVPSSPIHKVSLALKDYPELDNVISYFLVNSGELQVTYDD